MTRPELSEREEQILKILFEHDKGKNRYDLEASEIAARMGLKGGQLSGTLTQLRERRLVWYGASIGTNIAWCITEEGRTLMHRRAIGDSLRNADETGKSA